MIVKCFTWLIFYNMVNTWDNLLKKGWIGPNLCHLCFMEAGSVDHLFNDCCFGKAVGLIVSHFFDVSFSWEYYPLNEVVTQWMSAGLKPKYLLILCCWFIWKARNDAIFGDIRPKVFNVMMGVIKFSADLPGLDRVKPGRVFGFPPMVSSMMGFFDGAVVDGRGGLVYYCILVRLIFSTLSLDVAVVLTPKQNYWRFGGYSF